MNLLRSVVLYTALALGANAAHADTAALEALREGDMKKMSFHRTPIEVPITTLYDLEGNEVSLEPYRGKYLLVNFWATWCPPCRAEMPGLDALQGELGSDKFEVVTIAVGRQSVHAIRKMFREIEIEHLPVFLDPQQELAREMAVLGLPITLIVDPEGREIARLQGDAEWDSASAKAIVTALTNGD